MSAPRLWKQEIALTVTREELFPMRERLQDEAENISSAQSKPQALSEPRPRSPA